MLLPQIMQYVERETIFAEEVDMLMEGKSVEEIMAFMDENERTLQENPFKRKLYRGKNQSCRRDVWGIYLHGKEQ